MAKVIAAHKDGYTVQFYKRVVSTTKFIASEEEEHFATFKEIVSIPPTPTCGSRARYENMIWFSTDLTDFGIH